MKNYLMLEDYNKWKNKIEKKNKLFYILYYLGKIGKRLI